MVHLFDCPDACWKPGEAGREAGSYRDVVDGVVGVVLLHTSLALLEVDPRRVRPPVVEVAVLVVLRAYTRHRQQTSSLRRRTVVCYFLK